MSVLRFVDLFAGAGGTSTGVLLAARDLGVETEAVAINHWPTAVATHLSNHGSTRHLCVNIETANPREVVPGGHLDLLWASPECTHHSRANGGRKPLSDQKRSGANWVLDWLEQLDVRCLILENVEEWLSWGDLDEKGRPVEKKRGRQFVEWWNRLEALGYVAEKRVLNAADYGDATTRRRLFVQARKDGGQIIWPEPTHRKPAKRGAGARFDDLPPWRAAREIIDWSDLGPSLFEREALGKKALSVKTRQRIGRGMQMFTGALAPYYIRLLDLPPAPSETDEVTGSGPPEPFITVNTENAIPKATTAPLGTITTIPGIYLATPVATPFTFGNRAHAVPRNGAEPIATVTSAPGGGVYLVQPEAEPFVLSRNGHNDPNGRVRSAADPLATITGSGSGTGYLVTPGVEPFVLGQQSESVARSTDQPIPTIATAGAIRIFSPTPTPFIDLYYGTGVADSLDDPLSTVTTKPRHALVTPIASVITPGFAERAGQLPRIHAIEEPVPTINAQGHLHLATATLEQIQTATAGIDPRRLIFINDVLHLLDIRFRMLFNHELAAAMGFPEGYRFTGTKTDVTKQIGNAVCVGVARALVLAMFGGPVARRMAS